MTSEARPFDAVVVGAGYIGCSVASTLAAAGLRTALIDQGLIPGGASRANYGNVQVQDAELAHSLPMVVQGWRRFEGLEEELDCSIGYRRVGSLLLIENRAQWDLMMARIPSLDAAGIRAEMVPPERLAEIEPLLDRSLLLGACYHADEGQVSPFAFMSAYLQRGRRHGLATFPGMKVTGLDLMGGQARGVRIGDERLWAGAVVLTSGAWTPLLGRQHGYSWPARHIHGEAIVTETVRARLSGAATGNARLNNHLASAAFFEAMHDSGSEAGPDAVLAVSQTADGHFLLGESGAISADLDSRSTWRGQAAIAREALRFLPAIAGLRILRGWAAPVAFTDDGMPLLGRVEGAEGLIVATAFKSTVVVTPLVGDIVSDLVRDGRTGLDLTAFAPDRVIGHTN